MSRTQRRNDFSEAQRIAMLESDMDDFERKLHERIESLRTSFHDEAATLRADLDEQIAGFGRIVERMDQRMGSMTQLLVGMLVSLATAAVLLAINVAVSGG